MGSTKRGRDEHVHLKTNQLIRQGGKPIDLVISESVFESYVFALNIAKCTEHLPE